MRASLLLTLVVAPVVARADVSLDGTRQSRIEECLATARRALAADYPRDDGDERRCMLLRGELECSGACDDWSCHTDACDGWKTSIHVELAPATGAPTAWTRRPDQDWGFVYERRFDGLEARVTTYWRHADELHATLARDVRDEAAIARRVLDRCLGQ